MPPELFLDRSLGRRVVAAALRDAGLSVRTMAEVYGDREQTVADDEWLERAGREDWIVLAKDKRFRYRRAELEAIVQHGVKAFILTSGNLTGAEQAKRFLGNIERIRAAAAQPGPCVYSVQVRRIERLWPKS